MIHVKIDTASATGSVMKGWTHGKTRAALEPPQLIFTKTGNYDVLVGTDLRSPNGGIGICYMYYYDYPRPTAGRPTSPECSPIRRITSSRIETGLQGELRPGGPPRKSFTSSG